MKGSGNGSGSSSTYYILVARYLERCGDHACKIGENGYYMATWGKERNQVKS